MHGASVSERAGTGTSRALMSAGLGRAKQQS